jgi:hypothetical protein
MECLTSATYQPESPRFLRDEGSAPPRPGVSRKIVFPLSQTTLRQFTPCNIVSVKIALGFIFAALLIASQAAQAQHKLDADGKEALPYVKMAADIALNIQQGSLNNFLAVFVSYRDSDQAAKDGDLGQFMKIKQAVPHGGWSAVCLFSSKKDSAVCVYFEEKTPFGVAAVKAGADGKLGDAAAAYQHVTRDMRAKNEQKLNFAETTVTTDYGAGLTAFQITTP